MSWLDSMRDICEARDLRKLVLALKEMVLDYNLIIDLLKRMVGSQNQHIPLLVVDRQSSFAGTSL